MMTKGEVVFCRGEPDVRHCFAGLIPFLGSEPCWQTLIKPPITSPLTRTESVALLGDVDIHTLLSIGDPGFLVSHIQTAVRASFKFFNGAFANDNFTGYVM
jgi:hypothetical protein